MADDRCIVIFPSTHMALRAERVARAASIAVKMIPVPRQLSADCNVGMETGGENTESLRCLFETEGVDFRFAAWPKG